MVVSCEEPQKAKFLMATTGWLWMVPGMSRVPWALGSQSVMVISPFSVVKVRSSTVAEGAGRMRASPKVDVRRNCMFINPRMI